MEILIQCKISNESSTLPTETKTSPQKKSQNLPKSIAPNVILIYDEKFVLLKRDTVLYKQLEQVKTFWDNPMIKDLCSLVDKIRRNKATLSDCQFHMPHHR